MDLYVCPTGKNSDPSYYDGATGSFRPKLPAAKALFGTDKNHLVST
jgi:hypothetical protein